MQSYFDLDRAERANLTEDEVAKYCDLHLMMEGVKKPVTPNFVEETPVELPSVDVHTINGPGEYSSDETMGVAFTDLTDAKTFLELKSLVRYIKNWNQDVFIKPMFGFASSTLIQAPTEEVRLTLKDRLQQLRTAQEANSAMRNEYSTAVADADKATKGIWEDYREQVERKTRIVDVLTTFEEYLEMANNDSVAARKFLAKVAEPDEIEEAIGARGIDTVTEPF